MKETEVDVTTKIKVPKPPNFVQTVAGAWLPLCALSAKGIDQLGHQMTEAMHERAHEQSKNPDAAHKAAAKGVNT